MGNLSFGGAAQFCLLAGMLAVFCVARAEAESRDPLDQQFVPNIQVASPAPNVWITDLLAKVRASDPPGIEKSLQLFAARNEFQDFQVHARAGAAPIQMNVSVSDFVNPRSGQIISTATNVLVHREAYLNITQMSDANGMTGLIPDPLIPARDPYAGELRNAFPVTVPANTTQSAWIDVQIPASAPSGYYVATVTVNDGVRTLAKLPVLLGVWAFTLPSTASLKSYFGKSFDGLCVQAYGGYNGCANYPGSGGSSDAAIEMINQMEGKQFLDHRISIDPVYYGPATGDWSHFDATYGALLNGAATTQLAGAKLTSLRYSPPGYSIDSATINNWVSHFSANAWLGPLFQYTCDEPPNGCTFQQALQAEQTVHAGSPLMKTLVTTDLANATQNNLLGDLNILVPTVSLMEPQGGTNQRSSYNSWLAGNNKHLWWYQACPEHGSCTNGTVGPASATWPSYMIDASPVRNRVFQWLAFVDRIEGELYYQVDYCWVSGPPYCGSNDPWTSVYAFGGNGDGTLIYPGTPARIGGTTPVPVSSIRLKHIRDGMQDFEYLTALSRAGYDGVARAIAHQFITNASSFSNNPRALSNARVELGYALHMLALAGR